MTKPFTFNQHTVQIKTILHERGAQNPSSLHKHGGHLMLEPPRTRANPANVEFKNRCTKFLKTSYFLNTKQSTVFHNSFKIRYTQTKHVYIFPLPFAHVQYFCIQRMKSNYLDACPLNIDHSLTNQNLYKIIFHVHCWNLVIKQSQLRSARCMLMMRSLVCLRLISSLVSISLEYIYKIFF